MFYAVEREDGSFWTYDCEFTASPQRATVFQSRHAATRVMGTLATKYPERSFTLRHVTLHESPVDDGPRIKRPRFILFAEWNYPTESGWDTPDSVQYEDFGEAIAEAKARCADELENFEAATGETPAAPRRFSEDGGDCGVIVAADGDDRWFYAIRVIRVSPMA